jgi:phenylacetate-CoA ligase
VGSLSVLRKVRHLKQAERLDSDAVKHLREERFRSILRHALTHSAFYRRYYRQHGIALDNADRVSLQDLPPINKKIMMAEYDDFVCDRALRKTDLEEFVSGPSNHVRLYKNRYHVIHTSGSSGSIGFFVYGPDDWDWLRALVLARVTRTKFNILKRIRVAFIGATDGSYAGISLARGAPRLFYRLLAVNINSPIQDILSKVQEFRPDILSGYSSGIHLLAKEQLKGRIEIKPKKAICSADTLTPHMRETVRKAFNLEPVGFYAASESICLAAECDHHHAFHLFDDWHCFEVVDQDLRQVDAGTPGRLLLTTLYNYTQPLIRYELDDEVSIDANPCPCTWGFPVIKSISGRKEEYLRFERPDGSEESIHPLVMVEFIVPGLEKLQVIQAERNSLLIRVVIHGDHEKTVGAIRERMGEVLKNKGLEKVVDFNVEVVDRIENDPKTGKFRLVVPLRKPKGAASH